MLIYVCHFHHHFLLQWRLVKFDYYRDTRASILDPCIQGIFKYAIVTRNQSHWSNRISRIWYYKEASNSLIQRLPKNAFIIRCTNMHLLEWVNFFAVVILHFLFKHSYKCCCHYTPCMFLTIIHALAFHKFHSFFMQMSADLECNEAVRWLH